MTKLSPLIAALETAISEVRDANATVAAVRSDIDRNDAVVANTAIDPSDEAAVARLATAQAKRLIFPGHLDRVIAARTEKMQTMVKASETLRKAAAALATAEQAAIADEVEALLRPYNPSYQIETSPGKTASVNPARELAQRSGIIGMIGLRVTPTKALPIGEAMHPDSRVKASSEYALEVLAIAEKYEAQEGSFLPVGFIQRP